MQYTVITTIQSGDNSPVPVQWFSGTNHAAALAALVSAAAPPHDDENSSLPEHMRYRVLAVALTISEDD